MSNFILAAELCFRFRFRENDLVMHSIPIRQDIAITGEINITEEMKGDVKVSAIGGAVTKARGAKRYGIYYVIVPSINREINVVKDNIVPNVKILGATTAREYFQLLRGDMNDTDESLKYLGEKTA